MVPLAHQPVKVRVRVRVRVRARVRIIGVQRAHRHQLVELAQLRAALARPALEGEREPLRLVRLRVRIRARVGVRLRARIQARVRVGVRVGVGVRVEVGIPGRGRMPPRVPPCPA